MAHNFKLTGDYYVSVDGSDSNDGLTKDTPKRTVQAGLNLITTAGKTLIIGAGVYKETISKIHGVSGANVYIIADGAVVMEGNGFNYFQIGTLNGFSLITTIIGITFKNYLGVYVYVNGVIGSAQGVYFNYCTINCPFTMFINGNSQLQFNNTIFLNVTISVASDVFNTIIQYISFDSCVILNTILISKIQPTTFKNNYVNSASLVNLRSSITATDFNYNNIQGSIIMNVATTVTTGTYQDIYGRYYDLSQAGSNPSGDGSIAQPYYRAQTSGAAFSYANHRILYPTMNANSISVDPKFNNIQAQDFTLQADSPHIGRASDGINNIGGTKYAIRHAATGTALDDDAITVTNLAFLGTDYVVSGAASGEVVSSPIFISSSVKVLQKIRYNGLLEFNKAVGGAGTAVSGNRNVPDYDTYNSTVQPPDVQGANPDRLVYKLRFSTQTNEPTTEAEWDNGGLWTAEAYETFEWNTKPSIDTATKGNGDPAFNAADTPVYLNVTWIQLKIKLRNDY